MAIRIPASPLNCLLLISPYDFCIKPHCVGSIFLSPTWSPSAPMNPSTSNSYVVLALSSYGGADVGEVLDMASEIQPGDFEPFSAISNSRAERILSRAKQLTNPISIQNAMSRASIYFRAADFFLHGNWEDPRIMSLKDKQTECFDQAISASTGSCVSKDVVYYIWL
jgi:hypothetical protein